MGNKLPAVHALQEDTGRFNVRTDVANLLLAGLSDERIAEKLDIDAATVAKRKAEVWAAWGLQLEDPKGLRGFLFELARDVYRIMREEVDGALARNKPAYAREMRGAVQAMLDVTGLRTLRVDVGSSQLAALMAGMMAVQRGQAIEAPNVKVIESDSTEGP